MVTLFVAAVRARLVALFELAGSVLVVVGVLCLFGAGAALVAAGVLCLVKSMDIEMQRRVRSPREDR